jgi:hypothetical protein
MKIIYKKIKKIDKLIYIIIMAVTKIDETYFLCDTTKKEIPINLDRKVYCVKEGVIYYAEGNRLNSYPETKNILCQEYDEPIKRIMLVHCYMVLIFDNYVFHNKDAYCYPIKQNISNVSKVLYLGYYDEIFYTKGNSVYMFVVTEAPILFKDGKIETFQILKDYCVVGAMSNGRSITFVSVNGTVYVYCNGNIKTLGDAKYIGNHYIFGCLVFCPNLRHAYIPDLRAKIKKIKSDNGGIKVTFKDGKKMLYGYELNISFQL